MSRNRRESYPHAFVVVERYSRVSNDFSAPEVTISHLLPRHGIIFTRDHQAVAIVGSEYKEMVDACRSKNNVSLITFLNGRGSLHIVQDEGEDPEWRVVHPKSLQTNGIKMATTETGFYTFVWGANKTEATQLYTRLKTTLN